jgi:hypothetical protein
MFDLPAFAAEEYQRRADHQLAGIRMRRQTRTAAEQALAPWAAMALRLGAPVPHIVPLSDGTPPSWHHLSGHDQPIHAFSRQIAQEAIHAAQKALAASKARPDDNALQTRAAGLLRLAAHFAPLGGLPLAAVLAEPEPERAAA